jgi:hypothetical protein
MEICFAIPTAMSSSGIMDSPGNQVGGVKTTGIIGQAERVEKNT